MKSAGSGIMQLEYFWGTGDGFIWSVASSLKKSYDFFLCSAVYFTVGDDQGTKTIKVLVYKQHEKNNYKEISKNSSVAT